MRLIPWRLALGVLVLALGCSLAAASAAAAAAASLGFAGRGSPALEAEPRRCLNFEARLTIDLSAPPSRSRSFPLSRSSQSLACAASEMALTCECDEISDSLRNMSALKY